MRIGSRRSALALAQAELVLEQLRRAHPGEYELRTMNTRGDSREEHSPAGEDKSRWVAELENALACEEIDLAVHSAKDVPGELRDGLALLGAPARASAEDVLCGEHGALEELPPRARVGTSSVRRLGQLRALREDIDVVPLRGNVDTRLRKLSEGDGGLAAIVLARAGLERLGREAEMRAALDPRRLVPAPGQGTLVLEGRAGDERARAAAGAITDETSFACLRAERALAGALGASCHTPLGAHAIADGAGLRLRAWVGLPDGSQWACDELLGERDQPEALGRALAERLISVGASQLLARAEQMAVS